MRRITSIAASLIACMAFTGVSVAPALASSAKFSPEFDATSMGALTLKEMGRAVFQSPIIIIECSKRKLTAGEAVLESLALQVTIEYSNCSVGGLSATISPAKYEFDARGGVSLLTTATLKGAGCTITFPSSKNQLLGTVKYRQAGNEIELLPLITKITSIGSGPASVCTWAEESAGRLTGNSLLAFASGSGSVLWK